MSVIHNVRANLKNRFPAEIIAISEPAWRQYHIVVERDIVEEIAAYLKNLGARFVISVGVDVREAGNGFEVIHIFSHDAEQAFFLIKTYLDSVRPTIKSITPVFPGAAWAELELQDLLGIKVAGHPNPKRLALSEDWPKDVFPLRKDVAYNYAPGKTDRPLVEMKKSSDGHTIIPIGPFYPVLEEPAFIKLFVSGEEIVDCDYRGFFNHRGIEKLAESKLTYNEIPFLAERICGICGFIHSTAYVEAVESAGGIKAPRRARYIRTILLEIERIHSHLLWLGIAGHIIGFDTVLMQAWRMREPLMWACETITGNRKTYGQNLIGGVRRDITDQMRSDLLVVVGKIEQELKELTGAIADDATLHARLKGVGILPADTAREYCVVGPTARGSNVPIDSRIDHPYAAYDELVPQIVVFDGCDNWARVLVRLFETIESIRLVREGLNNLPDGHIMQQINEPIPPGRDGVVVVEAPRGEAIHYVITGEDCRPYRWRVRAPTYQHLQALPTMILHEAIADVPITLGSMDPCFSCTERMEVVDVRSNRVTTYTNSDLNKLSRSKYRR